MPPVNITKNSYDTVVRAGYDATTWVNEAVAQRIEREINIKKEGD